MDPVSAGLNAVGSVFDFATGFIPDKPYHSFGVPDRDFYVNELPEYETRDTTADNIVIAVTGVIVVGLVGAAGYLIIKSFK